MDTRLFLQLAVHCVGLYSVLGQDYKTSLQISWRLSGEHCRVIIEEHIRTILFRGNKKYYNAKNKNKHSNYNKGDPPSAW